MKQSLLMACLILGISQAGSAATTCSNASLASYVALGSTGCMIGNSTLSMFQVLSGVGGSTPITPASITVTPIGSPGNPGLSFQTNVSASAGSILDTFFTYTISGESYLSSTIALSNSSFSGDGAVTQLQNVCAGGTFGSRGVGGCTGTGLAQANLNTGTNAVTFAGVPALQVSDNFTVDGGLSGSASGGTFSDSFTTTSTVPEPSTVLLVGLGFAVVAYRKRRLVFAPVEDKRRVR